MRITFVADYRSPIAQGWIQQVASSGHDVQVISSRPVDTAPTDVSPQFVPLGPEAVVQDLLRRVKRSPAQAGGTSLRYASSRREKIQGVLRAVAPLELQVHRRALRKAIQRTDPDVVHALRLPFEGMAAAAAWPGPVVASIWGNDLTLHAPRNLAYRSATRRTLNKIAALHTDCHRDQRLAVDWGFDPSKSTLVAPGSGGIATGTFRPGPSSLRRQLGIHGDAKVILNARGVRGYTRIPEFLKSLEILLLERPDVHVLLTGMRGHERIESAIALMPGCARVHMLPQLDHTEMPDVHRAADISLSLTTHDGTPNTLLESMASGVFPIVSPVESVLEWITDGLNGSVVSATDPAAIASCIAQALDSRELRESAGRLNVQMINERAAVEVCRDQISRFYDDVAARAATPG